MSLPLSTRTEHGYQIGNLVAEKLPPRQALTLIFTALGFNERKSAEAMECSIHSVKQAKQALFYKLNAHNSTEAITKAFANAYLRFLSIGLAFFLGVSAPTINDYNSIARLGRTRQHSQVRARGRAFRTRDGGLFWSPDTNELVWS
jgi:DNA-binding CsgD family transcriptional regulator